MGLQKILLVLAGLGVLMPVYAGEATTAAAAAEEPGKEVSENLMDERIEAYRESMRLRKESAGEAQEKIQADAATDAEAMDIQLDTAGAPAAGEAAEAADAADVVKATGDKDASAPVARVDDHRKQFQEAMRQRRDEREAQARAWREEQEARAKAWREQRRQQALNVREAREKQQQARMNGWLKQQEARQRRMIDRHEAMRNRAEDEYNFLVENQDKMLEKALKEKIDVANRHEEIRREADQRRKKLAAFRSAMKDMTPEERRAYMDKHRDELFPQNGAARPRGRPAPPFAGMQGRPLPPPWMRQVPPAATSEDG